MKTLLFSAILVVTLLVSCHPDGLHDKLFSTADSLMDSHPDSALHILEQMGDSTSFSKRDRMRWMLLLAKAQNKSYATMPDDSMFEEVVEYYDRNGTPNDQMQAHYLYGCISRDLGDAPRALERYLEAAACADTTSSDCDHATLMGVYGQMAELFNRQGLPEEEVRALGKSGEHALKAGNVRNYIRCVELLVRPYYEMDDTAAVFETTLRARDLYLRHGFKKEAAAVFPTAIYVRLKQGRYKEARAMMDEFERHSGVFVDGEIESSRSGYESSRGMYFEGVHQLDSADFHYRKALSCGHPFGAYRGLLSIFSTTGQADSVRKYAPLYVKSVDEAAAEQRTKAMLETKALYDYTRMEKMSAQKAMEARQTRLLLVFVLLVALGMGLMVFSKYRKYKGAKLAELARMSRELVEMKEKREQRENELKLMETDMEAAIQEKQREITTMAERAKNLQEQYERLARQETVKSMMKEQLVEKFRSMTALKSNWNPPASEDWDELEHFFQQHLPSLSEKINGIEDMTPRDKRICMLCLLDFNTGEMAALLETSKQSVSNAKRKANNKIFGKNDAASLATNLMKL